MRKRIVVVMSAVAVVGGIAAAGSAAEAANPSCNVVTPSSPCDVTLTAVVGPTGLLGTRTLGAVAPIALAGTSSLTGALSVPVVETTASGDNAWSVTAVASNLTNGGTGTINASNLSVTDTGLPSGVGCLSLPLGQQCTVAGGSAGRTLNSAQTLFSVSGESTSASYTGTYAYTGTLSLNVPNGTPTGSYNGSLTLTLVQ